MTEQPTFGQRLARWFAQASPTRPAQFARARTESPASEAQRKSVHDVTFEQLGLAHWSCHTLF